MRLVFKGAGFGLSSLWLQTFSGGCLLPVIAGRLAAFGFVKLIPDNPCGGAYTPDAFFLPQLILPLTTFGAVAMLFISVWRR